MTLKKHGITGGIALALIFFLLTACKNVVVEDGVTPQNAEGLIPLRIGAENTAGRSVLPSIPALEDIPYFSLYGTTSLDGQRKESWIKDFDEGLDDVTVMIRSGTWKFTLYAYLEEAPYDPVLQGSRQVTITGNYSDTVLFSLSPVSGEEYTGSVRIEIVLPPDSGVVSVETAIDGEVLEPALDIEDREDEEDNPIGPVIVYEADKMAAGEYLFTFSLYTDTNHRPIAVITEIAAVRGNVLSAKTIPLTPEDLNAPAGVPLDFYAEITDASGITGAIGFTWTAVSRNETGFVITDNAAGEPNTYTIPGEAASYTLASVPIDGSRSYAIKAVNDFGESPWSAPVDVKPGIPSNVTAAPASDGSVTVSWDAAPGATGYYVYRSGSAEGDYSQTGTSTTTAYTDTGLSSGTTYYYKAAAYNAAGTGGRSASASAATVPASPTGLAVSSVTSSSATLTWTAVSGATGYYMYRSGSAEGSYEEVGSSTSDSYTDTGLASDTTYYYKAAAYNAAGTGGRSAYISATTVLPAPTGLTASPATSSSITLSWTAVSGAAGYYVYRSGSAEGDYSQAGTSTTTSYADTGLSSGTTYYYKAAAYNAAGTGDRSAYTSAATPVYVYFYVSLADYQGSHAEYQIVTTAYNNTITVPASPPPPGGNYFFDRWVYKDAAETIQEFTMATLITSNMYVWAEWIQRIAPVMGTELTDRQWAAGNIGSSIATVYHYFWATAGSSYTVRLNDYYQGDGTKTADVKVSAYWYDTNTSIFSNLDQGYTNGQAFTASRTGYVMLRVDPYSSYSSGGTYAIAYADLANPVPIIGAAMTAGQWAAGSVSSSSSTQYHYFYATAGTSYTVRWNDHYQGDGTKTGDVYVFAYWYDTNTSIFSDVDSGYTSGQTFTASRTGYVMLCVYYNGYYTGTPGTYAITYQ
jgi:fibronectin type 3 domain-containing protein